MAGIKELIFTGENGTLNFGNYELESKAKKSDFEFKGDSFKVKTYREITKLEKNEMFAYESVPGTAVTDYRETEDSLSFIVEGIYDTQIIVAAEDDTEYEIKINDVVIDNFETNLTGKLVFSAELGDGKLAKVEIKRK